MMNKKIKLLCSGVALGVYIPGISLQYQLIKIGYDAEVVVLENLLPDTLRNKIPETKQVFHSNFRLAQMGQKIARDITPSLDPEKTRDLFSQWKEDHDSLYILLSGFWIPLFEQYDKKSLSESRVMILHMDSVPSPSWKFLQGRETGAHPVFIFDYDNHAICSRLNVSSQLPIPFQFRDNRYLAHGGGWGMGTYRNAITALENRGHHLDIIAYNASEICPEKVNNRYYMVDPHWHPWIKNSSNEHSFPPVACFEKGQRSQFSSRPEYHELFYVGARSKAIISKPGGSTLVDSLASATPFIFLDSFGPHEDFNASLWIEKGLGVKFSTWENVDFSDELLENCHLNLMKVRETTPDFLELLKIHKHIT
jgi:hypothetical protein